MEYSLTHCTWYIKSLNTCLNPYSNGILSDCNHRRNFISSNSVLILILMEYSLTLETMAREHTLWS